MSRKGCLMCEHFRGVAPTDWKPSYDGEEYDRYNLRSLIREKQLHQTGRCHLNPTPYAVLTNHECSHFDPIPYAVESLQTFIWGSHDSRLGEQVKDLKRQLKEARAKSAKRMQRIKELTGKQTSS